MNALVLDAPAKINLRLVVLAREESGFHGLETLFCAISLADRVRVEPGAPGIHLEVLGDVDTGPIDRNLALRAAKCFFEETGIRPAIRLVLEKRIPSAGGLGGGSSDAAATLRVLNACHGDPLDAPRLRELGATLGSDVTFFLAPQPYALAWSRGERILTLDPPEPRHVLVAHPGIDVPTPEAFQRLAHLRGPRYHPSAHVIDFRALSSWTGLETLATNDLEDVARERIPLLDTVKAAMRSAGAGITLLSGSGASIFGVFPDDSSVRRAEEEVHALGCRVWRSRTLSRWPEPAIHNPESQMDH
jgi:4-diphosphocytidyl-2-C-methyl-D-erythritol kinase